MSTEAIAPIRRVAIVFAAAAVLLAPIDVLAAATHVATATHAATTSSVLAPAGQLTPIALRPGRPSAKHPVVAQPFRTLDPGALRAAKLRAAAIASRGSRRPLKPSNTSVSPLSSFFNNLNSPGLSNLTVAPPDSTGAIGPSNYIEMVNQNIGVYDRSLNQISTTDNGSFMGTGAGTSVSDPQIQWDGRGGRWLYAGLGVATGNNLLLFGWSKTSDPSDLANGWCRFGIFRANLLDDYPKLGHDDNFISIGVNVYDDSQAFKFITANVFAIPMPAVGDTSCVSGSATYFADAASVLHNRDGSIAFTPVPANTADASAAGYIVAAHSPVDGVGTSAPKIMVWHLASVSGSPTLVADGDVDVGGSFDVPAPVPQPGTSYTLDSLDARLTQAVAVNDPGAGAKGIWTQHTVAGLGGRSIVRWYEILGGAPPTLRQQGNVSSTTDFVFNGAVSPSIGGDSAAVFYNRGSASTLPIIGALTRSASTPLGSLDAGELVIAQSSAADLDFTCGYSSPTAPCRWGDYAGASPDPANAGVIWGSSQVTGPCYIFCSLFAQWQTQNFAVVASTAPPPPPPVPPGPPTLNTATAGNATVSLGWSAPSSDGGAQITGYTVYRGTASGGEVFLANTGAVLTFNDTGLTNGTTYYYKVAAINSAGTGTRSNERSATPTAPPPSPDFSLSVAPTSRTVSRGASTTYTVTVTALNGFSGTVTLASSISPAATGLTMSFSGTTVTGSGSSTLTVTTTRRTTKRTYTITITATSSGLVHTATVTLIVH
jgi:Fibronectin type III domain